MSEVETVTPNVEPEQSWLAQAQEAWRQSKTTAEQIALKELEQVHQNILKAAARGKTEYDYALPMLIQMTYDQDIVRTTLRDKLVEQGFTTELVGTAVGQPGLRISGWATSE